MLIESREYKVIVDPSWFPLEQGGWADIMADLKGLGKASGISVDGKKFKLDAPKERSIRFLDTPDYSLQANGLILRQRVKSSGKCDWTLKCRNEDRYLAAGTPLEAGAGYKGEPKFEEDVGVPFVSRFSHSLTIDLDAGAELAGDDLPTTLKAAAKLFPVLLTLEYDGRRCAPEIALTPVNGRQVWERVFEGPELLLPGPAAAPPKAELGVILWSKERGGRVVTAEFSFRYGNDAEDYPRPLAAAARTFFEGVQRLDWARPGAITKTQFMYGDR